MDSFARYRKRAVESGKVFGVRAGVNVTLHWLSLYKDGLEGL